ncbi:MAG: hypothetical protein K2M56_01290 [Muribaculaceae bacterium]|nr:hypothetical protein [Muribaculaceae bacterium]
MKRFIIWISIILSLLLLADLSAGLLRKGFYRSDRDFSKVEYIVRHADEDVIIIGNSAAESHLDPVKIADSLSLSCFNGGRGGASVRFHIALIRLLLQRHRPKLILYAINSNNLFVSKDQGSFDLLKPLYGLHSELLDSIMDQHYPDERVLFRSNLWLLNPNLVDLCLYKSGKAVPLLIKNKGFKPLQSLLPVDKISRSDSIGVDNDIFNDLKSIKDICQHAGVRLFIMITPDYIFRSNSPPLRETLLSLSDDNQTCSVWYDADNPFFKSDSLHFFDHTHLNKAAAEIYTDSIISRLKPIIGKSI